MNNSQINGSSLNGTPTRGLNALLSGGIAALSVFSAVLVSNAVLAGGIESAPTAGGRVSSFLSGGISSGSQASGNWVITTMLRGGALSDGIVTSNLGRAPGMQSGVESPAFCGGQMLTRVRLQSADTVGMSSGMNGSLAISAVLAQGVTSTSYASGNIRGSTVLMADGIKSNGFLSGTAYTGMALSGGTNSTSTLSARWFYSAKLQGGIVATEELGKELDIDARLQGGVIQVGAMDSPALRIGSHMVSGIAQFNSLSSLIIVSPASNGGVSSDSAIQSGLRVSARMQDGIESNDFTDSVNIVAGQKLLGGIDSSASFNAGQRINVRLQNGISATQHIDAQQIATARLQGGNANTATLYSGILTTAFLTSGIQSGCTLSGVLTTHAFLRDGLASTDLYGAGLRTTIALTDGFSSGDDLNGNIVQWFLDPLLNTSALEIRSATEQLSIVSPLEDI